MPIVKLFVVLLLTICFPAWLCAQTPASTDTLSVRLKDKSLTAIGCKPGGNVVWFGVYKEPHKFALRSVKVQQVIPADKDGLAVLTLSKTIPVRSVWVAVDMTTGAIGIGIPTGGVAEPFADASVAMSKVLGERKIFTSRALVDLLLVRPHVGAWSLRTGDGFQDDEDRKNNGVLSAGFDRLKSLSGVVPSPPIFVKDDVIVMLDPGTLEYLAQKIGEKR